MSKLLTSIMCVASAVAVCQSYFIMRQDAQAAFGPIYGSATLPINYYDQRKYVKDLLNYIAGHEDPLTALGETFRMKHFPTAEDLEVIARF